MKCPNAWQQGEVLNRLIAQQSNRFYKLGKIVLQLACLRLAFNNGKGNMIYNLEILLAASQFSWHSGIEYRLPCSFKTRHV